MNNYFYMVYKNQNNEVNYMKKCASIESNQGVDDFYLNVALEKYKMTPLYFWKIIIKPKKNTLNDKKYQFLRFQIEHYTELANNAKDYDLKQRYESEVFHFKILLKKLLNNN